MFMIPLIGDMGAACKCDDQCLVKIVLEVSMLHASIMKFKLQCLSCLYHAVLVLWTCKIKEKNSEWGKEEVVKKMLKC